MASLGGRSIVNSGSIQNKEGKEEKGQAKHGGKVKKKTCSTQL